MKARAMLYVTPLKVTAITNKDFHKRITKGIQSWQHKLYHTNLIGLNCYAVLLKTLALYPKHILSFTITASAIKS